MAKHINLQPILDQLKLEGRFQDAEANYLQELKVSWTSCLVDLESVFTRVCTGSRSRAGTGQRTSCLVVSKLGRALWVHS